MKTPKLKNLIFSFLLLFILQQLSFNFFFNQTATAQQKIKIGVSVPLTGAGASYGNDIKNALIFANKNLANSEYELVFADDQCSNREAVTVAHRLINVDKVKYMQGFGCSGTVIATAPVYNDAKVIVIASGTGAPAITSAGDYIFRTKPSLTYAADVIVKDMAKKYKKIGIITEETDYCQGLTQAISNTGKNLGIEIINENFLSGNQDFRTTLVKLKSKGVDALFLNPQGESGLVDLYKQLSEIAWEVPLYGTFLPGGETFIKKFGSKADGIIYADVEFNSKMLNSTGQKLYTQFESEYGKAKAAEHFGALTLVAFNTIHNAIKSNQDVKDYLYKTTFNELVDQYSFDKNGDVLSDKITYVLKTLKEGHPAEYEK